MRFFQYTARNSLNQPVQGTMQAATEDEARQALGKFGLQLLSVTELAQPRQPMPPMQRPATTTPPTVNQPAARRYGTSQVSQPPRVAAPQSSPYSYGQAPTVKNLTPAAATSGNVVHTKLGTDKQRFFLFSQLASALRAGINPSQAFHEVAQRSAAQFGPSLQEAANATIEGKAISHVLARYPDLYPDDVVGVIRAGEAGGFLPDALDEVARQAQSSHSFRRWFFWVWIVMINFALSIPGMWIATRGMVGLVEKEDKTGGAGGASEGLHNYFQSMWEATLWPWGPITIGVFLLWWAGAKLYTSRMATPTRHRVGLKIPVYGPRARHENLSRFSWALSRVSRAGIAPNRAWQLAADSVPNQAFREELTAMGNQFRDTTKMSDVMHRSPLFPDEYAPMIATGEFAGDLPGALQRLSEVSAGEFVTAQNYAKLRSGIWGALGCFVTSGIMLIMLFWAWYHEIPQKVLGSDAP